MIWAKWAECRVLEAAVAGGYELHRREASRYSRYLTLRHPTRPELMIRLSDHQARPPFASKPGKPVHAFDVHRLRALDHVVRLMTRGRMTVQASPAAAEFCPGPGVRWEETAEPQSSRGGGSEWRSGVLLQAASGPESQPANVPTPTPALVEHSPA